MKIITIVGAGMMGTALAFPARENGNTVRVVGTPLDREIIKACQKQNRHPKHPLAFPDGISFYQIEDLDWALVDADIVIGGVSSFGVEWFGQEVLPRVGETVPVLSVTKGLQDTPDGRLLTYLDVWEEMLQKKGLRRCLNAIGGPCTSYELVQHDQTAVTFCGRDIKVLKMLRQAMGTDYYHISLSTDVVGVESAVALKNAYALGVALSIGVNQRAFGEDSVLHFNSQAAVFGQAVREMQTLLELQGAATIDNLMLGAGDLYVTVYGGRTRQIGILLGRGMNIGEAKQALNGVTLESLVVAGRVAKAVRIQAQKGVADLSRLPLMLHIDEIITREQPVDIPWDKFTK